MAEKEQDTRTLSQIWVETFLKLAFNFTDKFNANPQNMKEFFLTCSVGLPVMGEAYKALLHDKYIEPMEAQDREIMQKMWDDIKAWPAQIGRPDIMLSQQRATMILKALIVINRLTEVS